MLIPRSKGILINAHTRKLLLKDLQHNRLIDSKELLCAVLPYLFSTTRQISCSLNCEVFCYFWAKSFHGPYRGGTALDLRGCAYISEVFLGIFSAPFENIVVLSSTVLADTSVPND